MASCAAPLPPGGTDPDDPAELMRQLALSQGIRVVDAVPAPIQPHSSTSSEPQPDTAVVREANDSHGHDRVSGGGTDTWQPAGFGPLHDEDEDEYDGDDEDESWDDVVSELGNPWDMRPARVGLLDDDDSMFISPPLSTLSNRISNSNPSGASSGPAEVTAAAAAGPASPTPPPPSGAPLYGQPGTFERLADVGELLELLGRSARSGSRVALLDVRDEGEGETDGNDILSEASAAAAEAAARTFRIPMASLRAAQAQELREAADFVVVVGSGTDMRAQQAYVRLTRVYGMTRVLLLEGGGGPQAVVG